MYRKFTTLLSPLLLAALTLPVFAAPQALAAPQTAEITSHSLSLQKQQGDYSQGFRDGFRKGHDDGEVDGQLECRPRSRPRPIPNVETQQTEYDRGFADGYPQGYSQGFARICGSR
jgi:flagellar biosynthesis/type III secretory pathway protein FliH